MISMNLDFGVDTLLDFKNQTPFPWLIGNVKDSLSQTLLADGLETVVAHWQGRKVS